jgi:hypothetical protein
MVISSSMHSLIFEEDRFSNYVRNCKVKKHNENKEQNKSHAFPLPFLLQKHSVQCSHGFIQAMLHGG